MLECTTTIITMTTTAASTIAAIIFAVVNTIVVVSISIPQVLYFSFAGARGCVYWRRG